MIFLQYPQSACFAVRRTVCGLGVILLLCGCNHPVPPPEIIRPVRVLKLTLDPVRLTTEFSGDVRARVESQLSFRIGGKIIRRPIHLGDTVRRGQIVMQLDPQDAQLMQSQANATREAARSNRNLAQTELKRYAELHDRNFISQAVMDAKSNAYQTAQAAYHQSQANYQNLQNQTAYATLVSDVEGVVTSVDAEVGQVVSAGMTVVRVAQTAGRDVVIAIAENQVDSVSKISDIRVRIWADPHRFIAGKLRELSPIADAATRTYTAKIAIPDTTPDIRLGMTAYVTFSHLSSPTVLSVPLSALLQDPHGVSAVWVVENDVVRLVPVQVVGTSGDAILLAAGDLSGKWVVTAGVNALMPGQKVRILDTVVPVLKPTVPLASLHILAVPSLSVGSRH